MTEDFYFFVRSTRMRCLNLSALMSILLAFTAIHPALADDWRWHGDIHSFHEHDYDHWREGHWFQGFHEGRTGWWWMVGDFWYFYPAPVYPYPDPYTPPGVVAEATPPSVGSPAYVYYCANPAGYYPYVPECFGPWQKIISAAAAPPVVAQPPIVAMPLQPAPTLPALGPDSDQRKIDDRQLNAYAVEFQNVDIKDKDARARLSDLEKQVETFRQSLFERNYNAMDILHDAEGLEHRMTAQREKLGKHEEHTEDTKDAIPPSGN